MEKKRISILMHGGVGGGFFSQGQPNISYLVEALANYYSITIYSQFPANPDFQSNQFTFKSPKQSIRNGWLRWLSILVLFYKDQQINKPDIIYAFWGFPAGFFAVLLSKVFKIKSVVHLQGGEVVSLPHIRYGALQKPIFKKLIKWTYKRADEIIVLTNYQNQFLQSIVSRSVNVIPFGVKKEQFQFELTEISHPLRCLYVGSLIPVKNPLSLLKCFQKINSHIPAVLKIVGEGPLRKELEDYSVVLGIRDQVLFEDFHPHTGIAKFYKWADLLIHTSVYEGQCLAITEAIASGVLVAGTKVGVLADLTESQFIVIKAEREEELTKEIIELIKNSNKWKSKILAAKTWSDAHSFDWTVKEIQLVLNSLS